LVHAIPFVVANVHEGWENVQSLHIKTSQSVSLPIWSCGERWKNTREKSPTDGEVATVTGKRRRATSNQQEDDSGVRFTKQQKVDPRE
jgi:ribosome biogenesis protein UTP30